MATNLRTLILKRLADLGKSRYWLAEKVQENPARSAIYAYLNGERDMRSAQVMKLVDALGIKIVLPPSPRSPKK